MSVLLPVHNAEAYICDALDSVLSQSLANIEVIAIDDGSIDGSPSLLDMYARRDERMHVTRRESRGLVATLNELVQLARGRYLARMDADDIMMPGRLRAQCDFLDADDSYVLIGGQVTLIDARGRTIGEKQDTLFGHDQIDAALLRGEWPLVHPSVMMRADAVGRIGAYRPISRWEDLDLFLRLAEIGRIASLQQTVLKYRLHLDSIVHKHSAGVGELIQVLGDARARRGINETPIPVLHELDVVGHMTNWVWWALKSGEPATARHYARACLLRRPFAPSAWRMFACALRGR